MNGFSYAKLFEIENVETEDFGVCPACHPAPRNVGVISAIDDAGIEILWMTGKFEVVGFWEPVLDPFQPIYHVHVITRKEKP